jgi:hypothetical protein
MSERFTKLDWKPQPKVDPFKPSTPRVPGTFDSPSAVPEAAREWAIPVKYALAGVGALALGAVAAWWLMGPSPRMPRTARTEPPATIRPAAAVTPVPAPEPPRPAVEQPPVAPGVVARVAELREPWATKLFHFRQPLTDEPVPAILVRLPGERGGLWAFSAREPFGRCLLQYVSDRERLAKDFGYRAQHPMVVDPCNGSVYHPLRWGTLPDGSVARGEVVAGPAVRPPLSVKIVVRGNEIHALQIEP